MKRRLNCNWFSSLYSAGSILLLSGCATEKIVDHLPPGSPRGYVDFYIPAGDPDMAEMPSVRWLAQGKLHDKGEIPTTSFGHTKKQRTLRLAIPPGTNYFDIVWGGKAQRVTTVVEPNLLTPVRVSILNFEESSTPTSRRIKFLWRADVESTVPVTPLPSVATQKGSPISNSARGAGEIKVA